jgi:hypothetical protein
MKSYFAGSLALIAALGMGEVAGQDREPPYRPQREIRISTRGYEDWMSIYDNGSGTVGYGAGGSYQVFFKAGTFDFEAVEKELRSLKTLDKGDAGAHYSFGFDAERKKGDKPPAVFATADREYVSRLFQKGIESHHHAGDKQDRWGRFLLGRVAAIRMADTWEVESAEHDGQPVPGLAGLKLTIAIPTDHTKLVETVGGKERTAQMKIAPDFFSSTDQFELTAFVGEPFREKRVTVRGVYALAGDQLRIRRSGSPTSITGVVWDAAVEQPEGKQPRALDAKEGVLLVLKRPAK